METATVNIVAPERERANTSYFKYSLAAGLTGRVDSTDYDITLQVIKVLNKMKPAKNKFTIPGKLMLRENYD